MEIMTTMGIATVASITVLCYIAGMVVQASKLDSKWIPIICGCVGIALGILALFLHVPDFPAQDVLTAAAIGAASGLAATGVDQAVKQLKNN